MTESQIQDPAYTQTIPEEPRLRALANELSEVLFDWSELSTMERKVEGTLLEKVSSILHRLEARPERIRDTEDDLMHMTEPDLGVALLRQFFLIKSTDAQHCVVGQLARLANSPEKKTKELTRDALKEAAASEVPRLQEIGCGALFQPGLLTDAELLAYAQSGELTATNRIRALAQLARNASLLAPDALISVVEHWGTLREDDRARINRPLIDAARAFDSFATLSYETVESVVARLYAESSGRRLANPQKKYLNNALAAVPEATVRHIESLGSEDLSSPAPVFALGECARRSPSATAALLDRAFEALEYAGPRRNKPLIWIAEQLQKSRHAGDADLEKGLDDLVAAVESDPGIPDRDQVLTQLRLVQDVWKNGQVKQDLAPLLSSLAGEWEDGTDLSPSDLWDVRVACEHASPRPPATSLSDAQREVLVEAMRKAGRPPWTSSVTWLMQEYHHFKGETRLAVQDAVGAVALMEKHGVESRPFRRMKEFFAGLVRSGSADEQQHASEWLDRLVGEKLPAATLD